MKKFYDEVKPILDRVRAQNMDSYDSNIGEQCNEYSECASSA